MVNTMRVGWRGGACVVVSLTAPDALPTGSFSSCHGQPSEADVIHDRVGPGKHQIVAVACIGVRVGAQRMQHADATEGGETVGGSSSSIEFSSGGCSTEMISDGCTDTQPQGFGPASVRTWCQRPKRSGSGGRAFR